MAGWEVVSQEPAAQPFEDRWAVVEETAQQDPWKPVSQTPVQAAAPAEPTFLQRVHEKIDPEPIIGGVASTIGRAAHALVTLPQRAIEASQRDVGQMGSGQPIEAVEPATEAAMATLPLRRTVGGVRAHPTDSVAAARAEPVVADPLAAPESADLKLVSAPEGGVYEPKEIKTAKGEKYFKALDPEGNIAAEILVRIEGNKARIEDILNPNAVREDGVGTLGNRQLRSLLKQFREQHPEITELTGNRISGARNEGKYELGVRNETSVKLPEPVKAAEPVKAPPEGASKLVKDASSAPDAVATPDPLAAPEPSPQQLTGARKAARVVQNLLNPDEVSPMAQSAAADIRQAGGKAARDTETTRAVLDAESQKVSRLDDAEKLRLIDYIETRSQTGGTPAAAPDMIRFYHGTTYPDASGFSGQTFVTPHYNYAKNYRGNNPHVLYMDMPKSEAIARGLYDEINGYPRHGPIDDGAALLKPFKQAGQSPAIRSDLQPVADAVKQSMDMRRAKIEKLDSAEKAQFIQDYYTHLWKDPEAAAQAFGGPAKEGSGRFLKERTIPTVAEGIARGLEPVSLNPLEVTMRYAQAMDRFIATKQVLDKGLKDGTLKHYTPGEQPPGWVEVNTRKAGGQGPVYAPADWARVYNNFVDRGIHAWSEDLGAVYDAARKSSNAVTALELGISGFHMSTMAQEALVNGVAKAIGEMAAGKPVSAVKSLVLTPAKPVTNVLKGRALEHVYLGKAQGTPLMREITDLLTEAGGRAKGMKHAPEYEYSAGGSYWDSFKHGTALMEAKALGREFADAPLKTAAIYPFRQVGRILQTFAKPLFEYTIPKLKNGAFYDNMASWMEANPTATRPEQLKAARKIWDSIDNRFGETVQDNIFWNKTLKQSLQLALRSYSWTFGTIQEIGGGVKDLARHPTSISPKSQHYSPKAAYVIALPIVYGTLNAIYQKIRTGKDPESVSDLMRGGLTGGTAPGVGGKGEVPERAMMPGYMKDVFGWYYHPVQEAKNKMATLPRMVGETITNKDWRDKPIRNETAPTPDQVRQYFEYVYRSLGPISLRQMAKGQKTGSNITTGEALLGLRPSPAPLQDPEGYARMKQGIAQRDWKSKERADKKQERQYGGPQ